MHSHQPKPIFLETDIKNIPPLYSSEHTPDPMAYFFLYNYFQPNQHWLVIEFDGDDTLFCHCDLGLACAEIGYVSLKELQELSVINAFVEIDRKFHPQPLSTALIYVRKFVETRTGSI